MFPIKREKLEISALALAYAISFFYRSMLAVIAPEVSLELAIDEQQLGVLSSLLFFAFALAQFPLGIAFDRYSPRKVIPIVMLSAALGTILLAVSSSYWHAAIGLSLIGVGCAPIYTGAMVIIARQYPAVRFAFLLSLIATVATAGDFLSSAPFAYTTEYLGWRGALWVIFSLTILSAGACWIFIRESKNQQPLRETLLEQFKGMGTALLTPGLLVIWPLCFSGYAVLLCIRGLWGGPYMTEVFELDPSDRGLVLMGMAITMALGTIFYGVLPLFIKSVKLIVGIGSSLAMIALASLAILDSRSLALAIISFCFLGFFGSVFPILIDHSRRFIPSHLIGRGMALFTFLTFLGVAVLQAVSGLIISQGEQMGLSIAQAYSQMFSCLAIVIATALAIYFFSKENLSPSQEAE